MPSVKALQCFHLPPTFKFTTKPQLWLRLKFTKSHPSGHLSTGCPQLTPWSASQCPPPSSSSPWTGTSYSHIWNQNCGKILKYKSDSLPGFIDSKCKILQIQHHNANSIQIQYEYNTNTKQIQDKYNAYTQGTSILFYSGLQSPSAGVPSSVAGNMQNVYIYLHTLYIHVHLVCI